MARKKDKKIYEGTDGRLFVGKAIKARLKLEKRQKDADITRTRDFGRYAPSHSMPGSMNRRHR